MQYKGNSLTGILCGITGGFARLFQMNEIHLMQIHSFNFIEFLVALLKAGITALVCGFLGLAGKWLWEKTLKLFKSK